MEAHSRPFFVFHNMRTFAVDIIPRSGASSRGMISNLRATIGKYNTTPGTNQPTKLQATPTIPTRCLEAAGLKPAGSLRGIRHYVQ